MKKKIVVEFGQDGATERIVFEQSDEEISGSLTTKVTDTTLLDHPSMHMNESHAHLLHSIIAQHINQGIDVTSPMYLKGLELGLTWFLFHQNR